MILAPLARRPAIRAATCRFAAITLRSAASSYSGPQVPGSPGSIERKIVQIEASVHSPAPAASRANRSASILAEKKSSTISLAETFAVSRATRIPMIRKTSLGTATRRITAGIKDIK